MVDREQEKREGEPNVEAVFGALLEQHETARREQREGGAEWLEARLAGLPESAKQVVREYDEKLAAKGLRPEDRSELVAERIVAFEQTYTDRRFTVEDGTHMLRDTYAKEQAVTWFQELLDKKPSLEDLKKVARLNFDANGLKAVNDLSGSHELGTEYLARIAQVFAGSVQSSDRIGARLREMGVTDVLPVLGSGDEYGVLIRADRALTQADLDEMVSLYEDAVSALDVRDLIDFENSETQLRYLGMSQMEFDAQPSDEQERLRAKFRSEVPEGFVMRASASGGSATLYDGLHRTLRDPRGGKRLTAEDSYDRAIEKVTGGLWDAADFVANENKVRYKEMLREGSPEDRAYSRVLGRTTEIRVLERKLEVAERNALTVRAFNDEVAGLAELLRDGTIDAADFARIVEEKRSAVQEKLEEF